MRAVLISLLLFATMLAGCGKSESPDAAALHDKLLKARAEFWKTDFQHELDGDLIEAGVLARKLHLAFPNDKRVQHLIEAEGWLEGANVSKGLSFKLAQIGDKDWEKTQDEAQSRAVKATTEIEAYEKAQ